jgi:hypothetical protein
MDNNESTENRNIYGNGQEMTNQNIQDMIEAQIIR